MEGENTSMRISVNVIQTNTHKNYSVPEIGVFLEKFHSHYYKNDLMFTIMSLLSQGVSPNRLVVFDSPLKLYKDYAKDYLSLVSKEINDLYVLGNPIFLQETGVSKKLFYTFKILRIFEDAMYSTLDEKNFYRQVHNYYQNFQQNQIDNFVTFLHQQFTRFNLTGAKNDIFKLAFDRIDLLVKDYKTKSSIDYDINFFSLIKKLSRPIVGILDEDESKISLLCWGQYNNKDNSRLEIKLLKKYNPFESEFAGSGILGSIINGTLDSIRLYKEEKRRDEVHTKKLAILEEQLKQEKIKTSLYIKTIEHFNKNEELFLLNKKIEDIQKLENLLKSPLDPNLQSHLIYLKAELDSEQERFKDNMGFQINILDLKA